MLLKIYKLNHEIYSEANNFKIYENKLNFEDNEKFDYFCSNSEYRIHFLPLHFKTLYLPQTAKEMKYTFQRKVNRKSYIISI